MQKHKVFNIRTFNPGQQLGVKLHWMLCELYGNEHGHENESVVFRFCIRKVSRYSDLVASKQGVISASWVIM